MRAIIVLCVRMLVVRHATESTYCALLRPLAPANNRHTERCARLGPSSDLIWSVTSMLISGAHFRGSLGGRLMGSGRRLEHGIRWMWFKGQVELAHTVLILGMGPGGTLRLTYPARNLLLSAPTLGKTPLTAT